MTRNTSSFLKAPIFQGLAAVGITVLAAAEIQAQVPDAAPTPVSRAPGASTPAAPAPKPSSGFLGKDVPAFDPGTEVLNWDGKNWNVNNNRLFQMRFEKYLNAPEATTEEDRQYQAIINEILNRLAPGSANTANMDYAFRLLRRGSNYDIDARLCDALADAVYTVWSAQRQQQRLLLANDGMMHEIQLLELATRSQISASQHAQSAREKTKSKEEKNKGPEETAKEAGLTQSNDAKQQAVETGNWQTRRLGEMIGRQKANDIKRELSEIAAKVEYQALIVQFFLQRRFQHVLMATRFYRAIFTDGDTKLNLGKESKELFTKTAGMAPTVTTLDSLANEAIRDVREGVRAFEYLLENNELESGTKRLAEAFTPGEYMPEIRTLSRVKKRKTLVFAQKANQLISALDVKDYGLAEKLVKEIEPIAKDFDPSKPLAMIESTKKIAHFRLAKARNAALSGDRQTLETELAAATELWPRNPELEEISQKIFSQGDVQQQGISDFDQLYGQKNYRQIFDNSARFIVATSLYPDRQGQLKQVMQDMQTIEAALLRAEEMRRQNNFAGAWESVEKAAEQFPGDSKLNQVRADLTTQAADFVRTLRSAQDLEKKAQTGSSLSWFLKAQKLYPASDFAHDGIDRLKKKVFPSE
jgi:hypothetical protein